MKKKVYLYGLRFSANLILLLASISVSQCCMGTSCFQRIQKIEIIERLQDEDEVGTV